MRARFAGQVDREYGSERRAVCGVPQGSHGGETDIVIAPWPIDSHRDHRAASLLTYDAWEREGRSFELYYSEVNLGDQSKNFHPTDYVNISAVVQRKRDACYAHVSQDPPDFSIGIASQCRGCGAWSFIATRRKGLCDWRRIREHVRCRAGFRR